MIKVTSIRVKSYDLDHLDIFWELDEQNDHRIEEYDFYVLRSIDGAAGPFQQIAGPFYNTFLFRDGDVQLLHKWRHYFYKIRVVHRASGRELEFGPEWHRATPDRIALEIQRREALLWSEFAGREVFVLPRLTYGQRCKHCWDQGPRGNSIYRETQQNCATCFDTTFVGGYATPMAIHMQIDPSPEMSQKTDLKELQFVQSTGRTVVFPPIKAGDMIVEAENVRWLVEQRSSTQKHRAVIRQELRLKQFAKDDIAYAVPINADLAQIHTPARAFTRPMDLQGPTRVIVVDKMKEPFA